MSARATILLTNNNEHWYEKTREGVIILEISDEHEITKQGDKNEHWMEIKIKKRTWLFHEIKKLHLLANNPFIE